MGKLVPMPATDATVGFQLRMSLIVKGIAKGPIYTWGDFKKACNALLPDDAPLAFIEYGIAKGGLGYVMRCDDEDPTGIGVREL